MTVLTAVDATAMNIRVSGCDEREVEINKVNVENEKQLARFTNRRSVTTPNDKAM